jgi:hypothetical protein
VESSLNALAATLTHIEQQPPWLDDTNLPK